MCLQLFKNMIEYPFIHDIIYTLVVHFVFLQRYKVLLLEWLNCRPCGRSASTTDSLVMVIIK